MWGEFGVQYVTNVAAAVRRWGGDPRPDGRGYGEGRGRGRRREAVGAEIHGLTAAATGRGANVAAAVRRWGTTGTGSGRRSWG